MNKQHNRRLQIPSIGIYYTDLLTIDSAINDRSVPIQAHSLLCSALQRREELIEKRLKYIADKEKISVEELREKILSGEWQKSEE